MVAQWAACSNNEERTGASPFAPLNTATCLEAVMSEVQPMEEWRVVSDFPFFRVSSFGRVQTSRGRAHGKYGPWKHDMPWRDVPLQPNKRGYLFFWLYTKCRQRPVPVHRLVLELFVGPCPEGMETCHWDGNPANNRLENLRWGTKKDNGADRKRHARHHARLTAADVLAIESLLKEKESRRCRPTQAEIAKRFGVSTARIYDIGRRQKRKLA